MLLGARGLARVDLVVFGFEHEVRTPDPGLVRGRIREHREHRPNPGGIVTPG
jgi:hypothetical protein